jgi:hypothetical protein
LINQISDFTEQLWRRGRKVKPSQGGWLSGNAVCCHHNGENADSRGRGGLNLPGDGGVVWHCFNCGFKTRYVPGLTLSFKYRKLLKWMGANENEIQRLILESLRLKNTILIENSIAVQEEFSFEARQLPSNATNIIEAVIASGENVSEDLANAVKYVHDRCIDFSKYNFFWSSNIENKLYHRVIVPFYYKNQIVGYTARLTDTTTKIKKYHSDHPGHFVFNLDNQHKDNKIVLVVEGPFDAMSVDGVSTQTNDISEQQADIIESLGKDVIVIPDFDKHYNKQGREVWPGEVTINRALEYGWSVSFPVWRKDCKDVNDAVIKYGKLFTLKSILDEVESNPIKIQILEKRIKNEQ